MTSSSNGSAAVCIRVRPSGPARSACRYDERNASPGKGLRRRKHLRLLGYPPAPQEARRFLGDLRADKRAQLIDELLERPEFAEFWAVKWSDVLRNEEKQLDRKGVQVFYNWIKNSLAANKPLNEFARELIAARGSTYDSPAANYY